MVLLSPTTSSQDFNILPRDPKELSSLSLTITEQGTGTTETFSDVTAFENGDITCISQAFTILKEHRQYDISITQDGDLWWRGKARCTSQTDKTAKHKLHTVADGGYVSLADEEGHTTLN